MHSHPALITTVHDPERRLLRGIEDAWDMLTTYRSVYAFATEQTDPQVIAALRAARIQVDVGTAGAPGVGQRHVLTKAVQAGHSDILYCDFDRWLHWTRSHPQELFDLSTWAHRAYPAAWYICLGRSERALATHPVAQIMPETITNRALSILAGKCLDATAGAAWIRAEGGRVILDGSTARTKATDLEWPGLIMRVDLLRLEGTFLEGLEFETADSYPEEIARLGSVESWIRATYDRPQILGDRLQLAADSVAALLRVTEKS